MNMDKPTAKALISWTIDKLHSKGGIDFILIARTAYDGIAICSSDLVKAETLIDEGKKEVLSLIAEEQAGVAIESKGKNSAKTKCK